MGERVGKLCQQAGFVLEVLARSLYFRLYLALVMAILLLILGIILINIDPETCRLKTCLWFGETVTFWTYVGTIALQFVPEKLRRKYAPESFLILILPLLTILALVPGLYLLALPPLLAQIAIGAKDTVTKYRRLSHRPLAGS